MPTPADAPLRKVTLNLYEADCQIFERVYGHGWSTEIREAVRLYSTTLRMREWPRKTLGDLEP
jgi:hypothetical protein